MKTSRCLIPLLFVSVAACGADDSSTQAVVPQSGTIAVLDVAPCACDAGQARHLAELFGLPLAAVADEEDVFRASGDQGQMLTFHPQSGMFEYYGGPALENPAYRSSLADTDAEAFASAFLTANVLLPAEATAPEVRAVYPKGVESGPPHHWDVIYHFQVAGPDGSALEVSGANITAQVGDGELLGLVWHWRPVKTGQQLPLAAPGGPEGGPPPRLVYVLGGADVEQAQLLPFYLFEGETYTDVRPASEAIPLALMQTTGPTADGTETFSATVTGGTPPFSYAWLDTEDLSLLGDEAAVTVTPRPAFHVRLRVTDSAGLESTAELPVSFGGAVNPLPPATMIGGAAGPVSSQAKAVFGNQWNMTVDVAGSDGLVITDLRFNQNLLASRVSMPSYRLATESLSETTCFLEPSAPFGKRCGSTLLGDVACWGDGMIGGVKCRSKKALDNPIKSGGWLVNPYRAFDPNALVVQAFYSVDKVSPDEDACTLWVAQTYIFSPPKNGCGDITSSAAEQVKRTACVSFHPLVNYWLVDSDGQWCDGVNSSSESWVKAFESRYRFDYDMGPGGEDYARYMDIDDTASAFTTTMQSVEGSQRMVDFGAPGADLANAGVYDDLHQKSRDGGGIVIPSCDFGADAITCAHMHWRWPALLGLTKSSYRPDQVWAPGSQRVTANVVLYKSTSYASTNPMALVNGEKIYFPGMAARGSDIETWVVTRSESNRGRNLWGQASSGWSDQLNNNEWFFQ